MLKSLKIRLGGEVFSFVWYGMRCAVCPEGRLGEDTRELALYIHFHQQVLRGAVFRWKTTSLLLRLGNVWERN